MFVNFMASLIASPAFAALDPAVWAELLGTHGWGLLVSALGLGLTGLGTVLVSNARQGANFFTCDLIATATTGQSATVAHGLGSIAAAAGTPFAGLDPQKFWIAPRNTFGRASSWVIGTVNSTSVVVTKLSVAASASSGIQATLFVELPMSLSR